jgi:iron complex transport system ATP-binding protein
MENQTSPLHDIGTPLIEFANITVIKGGKKILDSISVTISNGENVAILGPNGAGKSAFIKTITREYYPLKRENGFTFRIRGKDQWNVRDLRSTLGIVTNDLQFTFMRDISGMEVVLSGFFNSIGLFRQEVTPGMVQMAEEILAFLEISHLKNRKMTEMSSGEARRFLIARALIHGPDTLVLDEPTNSLDLHALHNFRLILRKIVSSGTGIILVTHNLQDIIPEISRVILIREGKVFKDGEKAIILTDENIGNLFSTPVRVKKEDDYYYVVGY